MSKMPIMPPEGHKSRSATQRPLFKPPPFACPPSVTLLLVLLPLSFLQNLVARSRLSELSVSCRRHIFTASMLLRTVAACSIPGAREVLFRANVYPHSPKTGLVSRLDIRGASF